MPESVIDRMVIQVGADLKELNGLGARIGAKFQAAGASISKAGASMTRNLTVPILGVGVAILKTAGDFEAGMNKVQGLTGATGDTMQSLTDQAKELGATTQFSASQAADAMGFLGQAGFDAEQILGSMPATLNLAAAAQLDLGAAADIVSNVMTGYKLDVDETARATDVLTKAFTSTNTDLTQLGDAMSFVGPVAAAMNIEFEESAAAIGLMGNAGFQGGRAGTALRGALARLASTAEMTTNKIIDSVSGIKQLGDPRVAALTGKQINELAGQFTDAASGAGGLTTKVEDLEKAKATLVRILGKEAGELQFAATAMEVFGQRAGPAMVALVGQGSVALREQTALLKDSGGAAKDMADVQMKGLNGAMRGLKSAVEGLAIEIGDSGLLGIFTRMTKKITAFIRELTKTSPEMLRMGTAIALITAAIGPMLFVSGKMISTFGRLITVASKITLLLNPVALAAIAVGVAAFLIIKNWDKVNAFLQRKVFPRVKKLGGVFEKVKKVVKESVDKVLVGVMLVFNDLKQFWDRWGGQITDRFKGIVKSVKNVFGAAWRFISVAVSAVFDGIKFVWLRWGDDILDIFGSLFTVVAQIFKTALDFITGSFDIWTKVFQGDWEGAWDAVKDTFGNLWENVKILFADALVAITNLLPGFIKKFLGIPEKIAGVGDDIASELQIAEDGAEDLKEKIVDTAEAAVTAGKTMVGTIPDFASLTGAFGLMDTALGGAGSGVVGKLADFDSSVQSTADKMTDEGGIIGATEAAAESIEAVGTAAEDAAEETKEATDDMAFSYKGVGSQLTELKGLIEGRPGGVSGAVDVLASLFKGGSPLMNGILGLTNSLGVTGVGGAVQALITSIPGIGTAAGIAFVALDLLGVDTEKVFKDITAGALEAAKAIGGTLIGSVSDLLGLGGASLADKENAENKARGTIRGILEQLARDNPFLQGRDLIPKFFQQKGSKELLASSGLSRDDLRSQAGQIVADRNERKRPPGSILLGFDSSGKAIYGLPSELGQDEFGNAITDPGSLLGGDIGGTFDGGRDKGGVTQLIEISLDGRVIGRVAAENMPETLQIRGIAGV